MILRKSIHAEITSIKPFDEKERKTQFDVLDWIDSGVEIFRIAKPATPAKHLVSYFAVIDNDYILLVDHINAQMWLPTGGHVEPDEHPRETVLREVKEELGIEGKFLQETPVLITSTKTVGKTKGHTDVCLWYVLKGDKNEALDFDRTEFYQIRWFHKNDVPMDRTDPEMSRFLSKLFKD
ncbi:MAG: NUDIX hydrolase [Xanthomonadales bacterium]|nr:NUDIX hydrolase [Xanthomonadales bacterium]